MRILTETYEDEEGYTKLYLDCYSLSGLWGHRLPCIRKKKLNLDARDCLESKARSTASLRKDEMGLE